MVLEKLRNIPGCEYFSKMERVAQSENCRASLGFLRKMKTFSFNDKQQTTNVKHFETHKVFLFVFSGFSSFSVKSKSHLNP